MIENLATKADYLSLKDDLETKIDQVRYDLENKIGQVRYDLERKIDQQFVSLYRHLWVMGTGLVLINVALVSLVMAVTGFIGG